jgi:RNA polymerase subunit RPABC4/transcription elongation factor Spt4
MLMFCPNCGANVQDGSRFCPGCGKAIGQATCTNCGSQLKPDANFCPSCGASINNPAQSAPSIPPLPASTTGGIKSDLRELMPGEVVLMDTGTFPISYIKNIMSSTNGKLYLTNQRLVFKAGALQGVGGVSTGGLFIPNPKDANKAKERFAIPLNEISSVESGWANIVVQASGQKYKFGGMQKTKEWAEAINRSIGR